MTSDPALCGAVSFRAAKDPKGLASRRARERARMREYIDNGTVIGWLINRQNKQVEIYRPGKNVEILDSPQSLSGENVLPGFILNLELIW